jgi:hypothetical protein
MSGRRRSSNSGVPMSCATGNVGSGGRLYGDFEAFLDLGLAGEIGKQRGPQRQFERGIGFVECGNGAIRHRAQHGESELERQGKRWR